MHCLVRYGAIPEVARCQSDLSPPVERGAQVVLRTHRGVQLGAVVDVLRPSLAKSDSKATEPPEGDDASETAFVVLRSATSDDVATERTLRRSANDEFNTWGERINQWKIEVQLVDLEWTLDRSKLILYVLNDRGPECTKLAIQAAAAGFGVIEVQPVSSEGLVAQSQGGGCGSCGCHN